MFRCGLCKKTSQLKEKSVRVATKTRAKVYPRRVEANRVMVPAEYLTKCREEWIDDPGGTGTEIVEEELWHKDCLDLRIGHPVL